MGDVPGGDPEFYPRDRVVAFLLLGPVSLFEEGLLAHPHPDVRNEIKIVPDWRRLGHVALSLMSLHSSWSSLCREGPGPLGSQLKAGAVAPTSQHLLLSCGQVSGLALVRGMSLPAFLQGGIPTLSGPDL